MSKAARSFLNAIALLLLVSTFGCAGPYEDFKVGPPPLIAAITPWPWKFFNLWRHKELTEPSGLLELCI